GFATERAADRALDHADVAQVKAKRPGDPGSGHEDRGAVHPDRQLAAGVQLGDRSDSFHGGVPLEATLKPVLEYQVRPGEGGIGFTALDPKMSGDVVRFVVVNEGRAGLHRLDRIEYRGQLFVVDVDETERLQGGSLIHRRDGCDLVADIA